MVMSAVSSVSTPGVLVTAMPLSVAALTSILSTPAPKLAISFRFGPALAIRPASMRSVMVGTSTSALAIASASSAAVIGLSSRFSRASNSSRMRVSTASGSLRVTMTSGFLAACVTPGGPLKRKARGDGSAACAKSDASHRHDIAMTRLAVNFIDSVCGRRRRQPAPAKVLRYVSQRPDKAYLREGPTYAHKVLWVYRHRGYPFAVIGRVRHLAAGAGGGRHRGLDERLDADRPAHRAGHRQGPGAGSPPMPDGGKVVALADPGAIAGLKACTRDACHIAARSGWLDFQVADLGRGRERSVRQAAALAGVSASRRPLARASFPLRACPAPGRVHPAAHSAAPSAASCHRYRACRLCFFGYFRRCLRCIGPKARGQKPPHLQAIVNIRLAVLVCRHRLVGGLARLSQR